MAVFVCPVCQCRAVSLQPRSGVLACHLSGCGKWYRLPAGPDMLAALNRSDSHHDDADRVQAWLDTQLPSGPPDRNATRSYEV